MCNKLQIFSFQKFFLIVFVAGIVQGTNFKLLSFLSF